MGSSELGEPSNMRIRGVIFDLDGTLLSTENVSKGILKEFLAKYGKVLVSDEDHARVGRTQKESALAIVTNYGLPLTPDQFIHEITPFYRAKWAEGKALPGANRLIKHLHKHQIPLALASNSIREYVDTKISYHKGWKDCFSAILGSDQVKQGKPAPDLFVEAAQRIGLDAADCLVVEDSLVGVKAAKAAQMKVVAVPSNTEADSAFLADSALHSLLEFQPELWGLPPFDDWVDKALPIDCILLDGLYKDGYLAQISGDSEEEDGPNVLPSQIYGVYFGWAKVRENGIFKVVFGTGLEPGSTSYRKNQISILNGNEGDVQSEQVMQLVLVGYIRQFKWRETGSFMELTEDDLSIARKALDQPVFICPQTDTNHLF